MTWRHVIIPVFTCVVVGDVWQEEIHELLLSFAEVGATVVRLKGGDPLVRSRPGGVGWGPLGSVPNIPSHAPPVIGRFCIW